MFLQDLLINIFHSSLLLIGSLITHHMKLYDVSKFLKLYSKISFVIVLISSLIIGEVS